jgi:hypothetical protein
MSSVLVTVCYRLGRGVAWVKHQNHQPVGAQELGNQMVTFQYQVSIGPVL